MHHSLRPTEAIGRKALLRHLEGQAESYATLRGEAQAEATYARRNGGTFMSKGVNQWHGPFRAEFAEANATEWRGCLWAILCLVHDLCEVDEIDLLPWFDAIGDRAKVAKLEKLEADGQPIDPLMVILTEA